MALRFTYLKDLMAEAISNDIYKDHDPENTEWWNAVHTARKHQRKSRRKFFDLWLDELVKGRKTLDFTGLVGLQMSGGSSIYVPIFK